MAATAPRQMSRRGTADFFTVAQRLEFERLLSQVGAATFVNS